MKTDVIFVELHGKNGSALKQALDEYRLKQGYTLRVLALTALLEYIDDQAIRTLIDKEIDNTPAVGRPRKG